jgi:hypothetical protein
LGSSGPCGVIDMKKELWYVGRVGKARNCVDVLVGFVSVEVRGEKFDYFLSNQFGRAGDFDGVCYDCHFGGGEGDDV